MASFTKELKKITKKVKRFLSGERTIYTQRMGDLKVAKTDDYALVSYEKDGAFDYEAYKKIQEAGNRRKLNNIFVQEELIARIAQRIAEVRAILPANVQLHYAIKANPMPALLEYLAARVGLDEAHASVSPEEKLAMVRAETALAPTVFLGDGINDAPAMTAATVGVAFGKNNDVTAEAAAAVVLDSSLDRLDELMHIGRRMRRIAMQTAIGGIVLSSIGMVLAVFGLLPPIAGAVAQEAIDVLAILNASRVAMTRRPMSDFRA
jgi:high-affinity K+ transport system ATPase subunit B